MARRLAGSAGASTGLAIPGLRIKAQQACRRCRSNTALRDQPGNEPRRRHVKGIIACGAAGGGDLDRQYLSVLAATGHGEHLVGAALLDWDIGTAAERPVDG